jgi:hypothetical protein
LLTQGDSNTNYYTINSPSDKNISMGNKHSSDNFLPRDKTDHTNIGGNMPLERDNETAHSCSCFGCFPKKCQYTAPSWWVNLKLRLSRGNRMYPSVQNISHEERHGNRRHVIYRAVLHESPLATGEAETLNDETIIDGIDTKGGKMYGIDVDNDSVRNADHRSQ